VPRAKTPLTPEQESARREKRNKSTRESMARKRQKEKEQAEDKLQREKNKLARLPLLPDGFCNTLNLAFRHCGGIEAMVDLCEYCADECEEAGRIVIMYRETVLDDRKDLVPEDLCRKADISPARLLGVLAKAAFQRNVDLSKMLMAMHSPAMIGAAAKFGAKTDGHQDRKMLLQAAGVVPMGGSKGVAVNINNANVQANEDVEHGGLPDFAEDAILITSE